MREIGMLIAFPFWLEAPDTLIFSVAFLLLCGLLIRRVRDTMFVFSILLLFLTNSWYNILGFIICMLVIQGILEETRK